MSPSESVPDAQPDVDPRVDVLLVVGAVLGTGTMLRNGGYHPLALAIVVGGFVLLCTQLTRSAEPVHPSALNRRIWIAFAIQASGFLTSTAKQIAVFEKGDLAVFAAFTALGTLAWLWGGTDAIRRSPRSPLSFYVCMIGVVLVVLSTLAASRPVLIDVYTLQEGAAERLLGGMNPYLPGYPDIYSAADSARFYGPGLSVDRILQFGFPYPPLTLLFVLPAALVGSIQLAHVAAIAGAAWLLSMVGHDRTSRLGAVFLLTSAPTIHLVQHSWTEVFVALLIALTIWSHRRGTARGVTFGLLASAKQYCLLFVPLYPLLTGGLRRLPSWHRHLAAAGVTATVVTLPFILWNPGAFYRSVVELHLLQPFRPDSLSITAFLAREVGWGLPIAGLLPFLVMGVAVGLTLWKAPRTPAGFALAFAICWMATILVSKQAFANYYYAAIAAIYAAVAASEPRATDSIQDNGDYAE